MLLALCTAWMSNCEADDDEGHRPEGSETEDPKTKWTYGCFGSDTRTSCAIVIAIPSERRALVDHIVRRRTKGRFTVMCGRKGGAVSERDGRISFLGSSYCSEWHLVQLTVPCISGDPRPHSRRSYCLEVWSMRRACSETISLGAFGARVAFADRDGGHIFA